MFGFSAEPSVHEHLAVLLLLQRRCLVASQRNASYASSPLTGMPVNTITASSALVGASTTFTGRVRFVS
jgi:hypothetical protein